MKILGTTEGEHIPVRTWYEGNPPKPHWYNAPVSSTSHRIWRWFDGQHWSIAVPDTINAAVAAESANHFTLKEVFTWSDYWPDGPHPALEEVLE